MAILAIDTSQAICSVAIVEDDETLIWHEESTIPNAHSELLFSLIDSLFTKSGYNYHGITDIGVVVGPGSFTGIRAGIAAAQGIKLTTQKNLYGVSILEMQGYLISRTHTDKNKNIKAIFYAHNNSTYAQVFNHDIVATTDIITDGNLFDEQFITYKDVPKGHDLETYRETDEKNSSTEAGICICKWSNAKTAGLVLSHKLKNNLPTLEPKPIYLGVTNFYKFNQ